MPAIVKEGVLQAFEIIRQEEIAAPIDIIFETILEHMGPLNATPSASRRQTGRPGQQ